MVHAACEALGVPILTSERYEADDVIGTLAMKAAAAGFDVAIVTMRQGLLSARRATASASSTRATKAPGTTPTGVKEKFGVAPEQVVDVLALMGDTIDNIKGVPGIGEKGARELIAHLRIARQPARARRRGQEQALPRRAARPTSTRRARAASWRASAPTCRSSSTPSALRYRGGSRERCFEIFNELGFRALAKEYAPTADTIAKTYRIVNTADGAARAGRAAARGRALRAARPAGSARGDARGDRRPRVLDRAARRRLRADRPPRARRHRSRCRSTSALDALRPVLEDAAIAKVGHDLKFDAIVLARHGVTLRGLDLDTMLASYLLDATRSAHPLEDLALEHTSYKALTEEDVCGRGAKAVSLADVPVEAALDYAGERADLAGQLAPMLPRAARRASS